MEKEKIDMQISNVKFADGGRHGIVVGYSWVENRGHFDFTNEAPGVKFRAPVNQELRESFEKLREFVIEICRFNNRFREDVEVTGITSNATSKFLISAKVRTEGNTVFAVNTPLIKEETGYDQFENVIIAIQNIYDQVKEYVEKRKMATPQQIVMAFEKDNADFDKDAFNELSEEDQIKRAEELLIGKGYLTVSPVEIIDDDAIVSEEGFGTEIEVIEKKKEVKVRKLNEKQDLSKAN